MKYDIDLDYIRKLDRIHPYPAKFTIDIALKFIEQYSKEKDLILDPFCGSGTTLLASKILNRNSIGLDINHVAILISKFKILRLTNQDLMYLNNFDLNNNIEITNLHAYNNINHWFKKDCIIALSNIKYQIIKYSKYNEKYLVFLNTIFSSIINIVSNQDSDTRYASIEKTYLNKEYVFNKFYEKLKIAIEIYKNINITNKSISKILLTNSKILSDKVKKNSISLIFTSPPYPNTYDYYLYHKHRMLWLDYDVNFSMKNEIGSRREYSSLKLPKEKFNNDLLEIFKQLNLVLKNDGFIIIIMGDGKINGEIYDAKKELIELFQALKWEIICYDYTELDQTSRSFVKSYRTKNKKEHIFILKKEIL
ncbi:hypothetical protein GQX60_10060 [Brachyspira hyodysenteriae]|uniref:DNA methyltransferase n=1 Tax=Brachyspira hyodysenteriae TaxID=159 RepID=UPI001ADD7C1A|nr:DNA methyltransferase [Brachyspira hyodysenteriae]QTM09198.1 hypothetical protein GQX60_10060 [Brachyspira hyodysenteriae]